MHLPKQSLSWTTFINVFDSNFWIVLVTIVAGAATFFHFTLRLNKEMDGRSILKSLCKENLLETVYWQVSNMSHSKHCNSNFSCMAHGALKWPQTRYWNMCYLGVEVTALSLCRVRFKLSLLLLVIHTV